MISGQFYFLSSFFSAFVFSNILFLSQKRDKAKNQLFTMEQKEQINFLSFFVSSLPSP